MKRFKVFDPENKKVIGKMKHESKGKINYEFVGLKSKMHSIKNVDGKENRTGKGIYRNVVKSTKHENYIVLFNKKVIRHNMKRIQSKLHRIRTYDASKNFLSCFDDKRFISDDGIKTLTFFYKCTRRSQEN